MTSQTNYWIKLTSLCSTLPSLIMDCLLGGWGDLFGRKFVLFLPSIGGLLGSAVYITVAAVDTLGVEWLCLAR